MGQFRPEKDHALQVRALAALRNLHDSEAGSASGDHADNKGCSAFNDVRLVILGSCRSDDDRGVLKRTRALAVELGVEEQVEFVVNCSFEELKAWLGRASVGLHTMWNEHFGIGVVEMMVGMLRKGRYAAKQSDVSPFAVIECKSIVCQIFGLWDAQKCLQQFSKRTTGLQAEVM